MMVIRSLGLVMAHIAFSKYYYHVNDVIDARINKFNVLSIYY